MSKLIRKYTKYSGTDNKVNADDQTYLAYKTWRCVQLHFIQKKYDLFKYNFKTTNSSRESMNNYFLKKEVTFGNRWCPERTLLHRIGRLYGEKKVHSLGEYDVWSYFIYQFTRDNIYLQEMHEEGFKEWLDIVDVYSWEKHFRKDLNTILEDLKEPGGYREFDSVFTTDGLNHPRVMKLYLGNHISLETVILMDSVLGFMTNIDNQLNDVGRFLWDDFKLKCDKYKPLMNWLFRRNLEYAVKNPIVNIHPSEYYLNLNLKNEFKRIIREVVYPVYV